MQRTPDSHKGENGKIAVIGGARTTHGAPLFSALAAEASGVDTLSVCVPRCHATAATCHLLNAFVHPFGGDDLAPGDAAYLLELTATIDAAVIGPGIARTPESIHALEDIIAASTCRMVLDATALQPWTLHRVAGKGAVLTPHLGELERMNIAPEEIGEAAARSGAIIVLKGSTDRIALPDGSIETVHGGNAGLTVGGTGDALAGLIAGLLAQNVPPEDACRTACSILKQIAEDLWPEFGYAYGTKRIIDRIARALALRDD